MIGRIGMDTFVDISVSVELEKQIRDLFMLLGHTSFVSSVVEYSSFSILSIVCFFFFLFFSFFSFDLKSWFAGCYLGLLTAFVLIFEGANSNTLSFKVRC